MRVMRARAFAVTSSSTASRGTARGVTARRGRAVASRATRDGEGVSDLAAMDAVIDLMLEAKSEEEVGKIVVENVLMFDQKMWMRFASRSDTAEGSAEKTRIMELAGACMKLVEAMVEKTENTMEEASVNLQTVVGAAADPSSTSTSTPSEPPTPRSPSLSSALFTASRDADDDLDDDLDARTNASRRRANAPPVRPPSIARRRLAPTESKSTSTAAANRRG